MTVPIQEAAEALAPLLAAGLDDAAGEVVGQGAMRLFDKVRGALKKSNPGVAEVEEVLRTGLADGTISADEVRGFLAAQRSGRDSWTVGNVEAGRDANVGNTFLIGGDYKA